MTQLHSLNKLSIKAIEATQEGQEALIQFLNYCASNPDATIIYGASNMIISCDSGVAHLVVQKSQSQVAGHHYFGNKAGLNSMDQSTY